MVSLSRLDRSRALSALILAAIFLLMLFCNHETDLVADDYRYCFSYADGSRISSVDQIFPSMAAHRSSMNGRVLAHFLVQLFLLLPKTLFDPVNALFFTLLVWLIYRLAVWDGETRNLLLLTVFGCLWLFQPDFGQVFLWLTGSVNYLWCGVFCLLWLRPWAKRYLTGEAPARPWRILYIAASFAMGAYSENSTVALVAMSLLFLLLLSLGEKRRPELWLLWSLASMLAGFFYMMLAPAEGPNKSAEFRLAVLFANFLENAGFYLRFWPLLLSYLLFWVLAVRQDVAKKLRALSLVFLFGSAAGHFVLTFAMYTAGRSTYIGLVLLICANAVLAAALKDAGSRRVCAALCALCLAFTVRMLFVGVADIRRTHIHLRFNEELIVSCAENGERVVQVPRPYPDTAYSAMAGLGYLNVDDPEDWPNVYMAKYYGVDGIIGY